MTEQHASIAITIHIALVGYMTAVCMWLGTARETRPYLRIRIIWTAACMSFVAHVLTAFHYAYRWNHNEAIRITAQQTEELLGKAFGQGLYFNYLFLLLWIADVTFWWCRPEQYRVRSPWISLAIHSYLFFIVFNGAVVFKTGGVRAAGIIASSAILALALRRAIYVTKSAKLNLKKDD